MRILRATLWGCFVLVVLAGFVQAAEQKQTVQQKQAVEQKDAAPVIEVENPIYDFKQVAQGETVKHEFRVFNRGTAPLQIKNVKPG
ncbi:MAG: DUF1573 domain-containing protein [Deltaproteobacteria bacterium]|nr:DUF1573 domain-containing protein [Deltaproteobacteria bacterium]